MSTCRYCHQQITWAESEHGHNMPLEPANGRDEGLFVLRRRRAMGPQAIAVGPALFDTEQKYVYHHCGYDQANAQVPY
jgi:hypothetical protein